MVNLAEEIPSCCLNCKKIETLSDLACMMCSDLDKSPMKDHLERER